MAQDLPLISGEFRIVGGDPELRFATNGDPICSFRLGGFGKKYDRDKNEWVDDKTMWLRVTAWKSDGAENIANSLRKGDLVTFIGRPYVESFKDQKGVDRTAVEARVVSIGACLRFRETPHHDQKRQSQQPPQQERVAGTQGHTVAEDVSNWIGAEVTEVPPDDSPF